jgi:RND family efflux transporter MFP subunit
VIRKTLFLLPFVIAGCSGPPPAPPQAPEPPTVTVANPIEQDLSPYLEFVGRTEAVKSVDIIPEVSGAITKIHFKEGSLVSVGAPLYDIDPIPYKAMADRAAADVLSAKAQLALAEADLARNRQSAVSGAISKDELDRAIAKRDSADAALKAADSDVIRTRFNLDKTQIKSPIAGRISRTLLTEGNLVAANSTKLTRIVSVNPIYAFYDIDEMTSLFYRKMIFTDKTIPDPREAKPLKAWLKLKNEENFKREGYVNFIEQEISRASATRPIRAEFKNEDGFISPGDSVRIRVEAGPVRKAILIPEMAVGSQQGQKYVYTINDKNEAMMTPVQLGEVRDGLQVVEKGVTPQDRIVVNGLLRVRPGVVVKPVVQSALPK